MQTFPPFEHTSIKVVNGDIVLLDRNKKILGTVMASRIPRKCRLTRHVAAYAVVLDRAFSNSMPVEMF